MKKNSALILLMLAIWLLGAKNGFCTAGIPWYQDPCYTNWCEVVQGPTGSISFTNISISSTNTCLGTGISASAQAGVNCSQTITETLYLASTTNCPDTYYTNTDCPYFITNWWTVTGLGVDTPSGSGTSAYFTPTNCGTGTITFYGTWTDTDPCKGTPVGGGTISKSQSIQADAVTSLKPDNGQWVDDGDGDSNTDTYLVEYGCYDTITVKADDCLGLSSAALPDCWSMTGGTEVDKKTHTVDGYQVGTTTITVSCGTSHKSVTIIVYQAIYTISADQGNCGTDVGHAWWALTVTPSLDDYLTHDQRTSEGTGGYYDIGVVMGPQPNNGGGGYHTATGSYWWCVSFSHFCVALDYVDNLFKNPGTYNLISNSCVTQALQVGNAAGVNVGYTGITPCGLSGYLNQLLLASVPYCYCQN